MNPFLITGPACISFSGGRTSGYMLWRILEAHGGKLPDDVVVLFANTGKEMLETLDFVQVCSERWNVPVVWLEYQRADEPKGRWQEVNYITAARNGEPFAAVIEEKGFLPNPVTRFCTSELKIKTMSRYLVATYQWPEWYSVVGIRADEPRRLAKLSIPNRDRDTRIAPLGAAGIDAATVGRFWAAQDFDLQLPNMNGRTMHGNCDLCFLKGAQQIQSLIREQPDRADWWAEQEAFAVTRAKTPIAAFFRSDRPAYAAMKRYSVVQGEMFLDEPLEDCACTD